MLKIAKAQVAKNIRSGAKVADRLGRVGIVTGRVSATQSLVRFEFGTYPMYNSQLRYAA